MLRSKPIKPILIFLTLAILCAALLTAHKINSFVFLFPDSGSYIHEGLFFKEFLLSGFKAWMHPIQYAFEYYCKFPFINIPYHAPLFPLMLGVFFLLFNVSVLIAHIYIAMTLFVTICCMYYINLKFKLSHFSSAIGAIWIGCIPMVAYWSNDVMSEIPVLMFSVLVLCIAAYWCEVHKPRYLWLLSLFVMLAFFTRYTAVVIIPGVLLMLLRESKKEEIINWRNILPIILMFPFIYIWVLFVERYSIMTRGNNTFESLTIDTIRTILQMVTENISTSIGWPALCVITVGILTNY